MTAESYALNNGSQFQEKLTIYPEKQILAHSLNNNLFQRLAILKDNNNIEFLEYDWYKDSLWVGLIVHPSYPSTNLHDFYLGKSRKDGSIHGFHFMRWSKHLEYYSQTKNGPSVEKLKNEAEIDWDKMGDAKSMDLSKIPQGIFVDPSTGELSFAIRLMPNKYAPLAQVSKSLDFRKSSTISVDTSFTLDYTTFEYILSEAQRLFDAERRSQKIARNFCEYIQMAFCSYFPMDEVS